VPRCHTPDLDPRRAAEENASTFRFESNPMAAPAPRICRSSNQARDPRFSETRETCAPCGHTPVAVAWDETWCGPYALHHPARRVNGFRQVLGVAIRSVPTTIKQAGTLRLGRSKGETAAKGHRAHPPGVRKEVARGLWTFPAVGSVARVSLCGFRPTEAPGATTDGPGTPRLFNLHSGDRQGLSIEVNRLCPRPSCGGGCHRRPVPIS